MWTYLGFRINDDVEVFGVIGKCEDVVLGFYLLKGSIALIVFQCC